MSWNPGRAETVDISFDLEMLCIFPLKKDILNACGPTFSAKGMAKSCGVCAAILLKALRYSVLNSSVTSQTGRVVSQGKHSNPELEQLGRGLPVGRRLASPMLTKAAEAQLEAMRAMKTEMTKRRLDVERAAGLALWLQCRDHRDKSCIYGHLQGRSISEDTTP